MMINPKKINFRKEILFQLSVPVHHGREGMVQAPVGSYLYCNYIDCTVRDREKGREGRD